jgi:hypothetical protein
MEGRAKSVSVLTAHFKLNKVARETPVVSWKALVRSVGCPKPVWISLISANMAELFLEDKDVAAATEALRKEGILVERPRLSKDPHGDTVIALRASDVYRRCSVYVRGYFRPLRQAAFHGLDKDGVRRVLCHAEEVANKTKDIYKRKQSLYQIGKDKAIFLREDSGGDSGDVLQG